VKRKCRLRRKRSTSWISLKDFCITVSNFAQFHQACSPKLSSARELPLLIMMEGPHPSARSERHTARGMQLTDWFKQVFQTSGLCLRVCSGDEP
jgi:hypothetical protein